MDAIKPILQRIAQPIVLTFIISWIFWNWEIVVSLLWYDANQIKNLGHDNHAAYIKTLSNPWYNYYYPILFAFLYPILTLGLNSFYTYFKKHDDNLFHWISKGAHVPTSLYLDVLERAKIKEQRLSAFIIREQEIELELYQIKSDNEELVSQLTEISEEIKFAKSELKKLEEEHLQLSSFQNEVLEKSKIAYLVGKYRFRLKYRKTKDNDYVSMLGELEVKNLNEASYLVISYEGLKNPINSKILSYFYDVFTSTFILICKKQDANDKIEHLYTNNIFDNLVNGTNVFKVNEGDENFTISTRIRDTESYFEANRTD